MNTEVEFVSKNDRQSHGAANDLAGFLRTTGVEYREVPSSSSQSVAGTIALILSSAVVVEFVRGLFAAAKKNNITSVRVKVEEQEFEIRNISSEDAEKYFEKFRQALRE